MANEYNFRTNLGSLNISRETWNGGNTSDRNEYGMKPWGVTEFHINDGMSLFPQVNPQEESPSASPLEKSIINSQGGEMLEAIPPGRKGNPFDPNREDYQNSFQDLSRSDFFRTHPIPPVLPQDQDRNQNRPMTTMSMDSFPRSTFSRSDDLQHKTMQPFSVPIIPQPDKLNSSVRLAPRMEDPFNTLRFPLSDKHQAVYEKSSLESFKPVNPFLPNMTHISNNNNMNNNNNAHHHPNHVSPQLVHPPPLYNSHSPQHNFSHHTFYAPPIGSLSQSTPSPSTNSIETGNNFFELGEQPYETQRKCYSRENRCILPNPLQVTLKKDKKALGLSQILDGVVFVKLVAENGKDLHPSKQNTLKSIDGGLSQPLDLERSTNFSLKVLETTDGERVRLCFTINYRTGSNKIFEEKIFSSPFEVCSNSKRRKAPGFPNLKNNPEFGLASSI